MAMVASAAGGGGSVGLWQGFLFKKGSGGGMGGRVQGAPLMESFDGVISSALRSTKSRLLQE